MRKCSEDTVKLCEFCRYSASLAMGDDMLCEKRGVVKREYSCRKFMYDPLKRVPRKLDAVTMPEDLTEEL